MGAPFCCETFSLVFRADARFGLDGGDAQLQADSANGNRPLVERVVVGPRLARPFFRYKIERWWSELQTDALQTV